MILKTSSEIQIVGFKFYTTNVNLRKATRNFSFYAGTAVNENIVVLLTFLRVGYN